MPRTVPNNLSVSHLRVLLWRCHVFRPSDAALAALRWPRRRA
jgi:hypothetical protein